MAEITKVTTPIIPKENMGAKLKPETDQAFPLTDTSKVVSTTAGNGVADKKTEASLHEKISRQAVLPLLRPSTETLQAVKKLMLFAEMGISTSDVMLNESFRQMLEKLFVAPEHLLETVREQEQSAMLFKGESFDILRDILQKYAGNPKVQESIVQLLKAFEYKTNQEHSLRAILTSCDSILDYMFKQDREQFSGYLEGLKSVLLLPEQPEAAPLTSGEGKEVNLTPQPLGTQETAQLLKNNLVPLLGEIVGKYHQSPKIRDIVMVIIHNVVRVDKGSEEALKEAVAKLMQELKKSAVLPQNFERRMLESLLQAEVAARQKSDSTTQKLVEILSASLREGRQAGVLRQSENLLFSLLQNQNPIMDVLHYVLPLQLGQERAVAELYVDPDNEEREPRSGGKTQKIFLSVDSEGFGAMELSLWVYGGRIDCSLHVPEPLLGIVKPLKGKFASIAQNRGYQMGKYVVEELKKPQTIAEVFPKLLSKRTGVDVRI